MSQLTMCRADLVGLPEIPPLPAGYTLREARLEDRAGLARLMAAAFADPAWDVARVDRDLLDDPAVPRTLVVVFGKEVVATASVQLQPRSPRTGTLHWVASDPAHRGMKLGAVVSLAVLLECVRLGLSNANLLTDDERLPAIRTYLSLGFEPAMLDDSHPARWARVMAALARR